jgi:hypothetical protein
MDPYNLSGHKLEKAEGVGMIMPLAPVTSLCKHAQCDVCVLHSKRMPSLHPIGRFELSVFNASCYLLNCHPFKTTSKELLWGHPRFGRLLLAGLTDRASFSAALVSHVRSPGAREAGFKLYRG